MPDAGSTDCRAVFLVLSLLLELSPAVQICVQRCVCVLNAARSHNGWLEHLFDCLAADGWLRVNRALLLALLLLRRLIQLAEVKGRDIHA